MTTKVSNPGQPARTALFLDRRFWIVASATVLIALYFWTQSRYPALSGKAEMGGETPVTGISFDALVELLPTSGIAWEMAGNALNWLYTNWKGMTFGVMFGACALTILELFERRSFRSPFANAALGAAIGMPLGVCVNCAAPIARGLHGGGMRLETTLGAMMASPTLNVVVVSMSFALLPTYMAATKLAAMLGFILIGVPLLSRFFFKREAQRIDEAGVAKVAEAGAKAEMPGFIERLRPPPPTPGSGSSWGPAVRWAAPALLRNFLYIVVITVPLMLLAGALGAIVITLIPFEWFDRFFDLTQGPLLSVILIVAIAAVAIVLPVPMSFDVIIAVILINSGWPARYVMPLLLGLGSFSIYSFLILARAISLRVAVTLMASLALLAATTGLMAEWLDRRARQQAHLADIAFLRSAPPLPTAPPYAGSVYSRAELAAELGPEGVAYAPLDRPVTHQGAGSISIETATLQPPQTPAATGPAFTRFAGGKIGLDLQPFLGGLEVVEPYTMYWAMAAADVNGDGWSDIAMARPAAEGGIVLFVNRHGRFVREQIDLGPAEHVFVGTLALTDLNNDGRPDLFVSTFLHGSYVFWNNGGGYGPDAMVTLPNRNAPLIGAPAFADLDGDGAIDIVAANWSTGTIGNNHAPFLETSSDRILWNDHGRFVPQELQGLPGESLTSLVTDLNDDGLPDIMIGDDVSTADQVYINQGGRRFRLLRHSEGLIPWGTYTTMSLDAGDIDNDLHQELYNAQIAFKRGGQQYTPEASYCVDPLAGARPVGECFAEIRERTTAYLSASARYSECARVADPHYRAMCAVVSLIRRAGYNNDPGACASIPAHLPDLRRMCLVAAGPRVPDALQRMRAEDYVGGIRGRNVFLRRDANGHYIDQTAEFGVAKPGWSWNSRFVDLDQDGWQDLFVGSGFLTHRNFLSNTFYRNLGGLRFENDSVGSGLTDEFPTSSYVLIDYDRDGDLDVIRASAASEPIVHRSDRPAGGGLFVRLVDEVGNRAGVGARIVVRTGRMRQLREIRQSGGFASFDPAQAHFGLGAARQADEIAVTWPDGARTVIAGPIDANSELVVRRRGG
jgi:uncharacterized membrane protein YraQ (UPF0718 family)